MKTNTPINTIDFNGTELTVVEHQGLRWLTAEQVGGCLGYAAGNERLGVMKLHERHADEFTETDTCVVKLTTQGQEREMRIFSATGCNKLGFFASTSRAKEFRTWASRVLAGQAAVMEPTPALTGDKVDKLLDLMEQILRVIPKVLDAATPQRSRPSRKRMYQEDVTRILALREQGYTLDDLVLDTEFSQTQCWCVITGRYKVLQSGRVSIDARTDTARAADAASKAEQVSAATGSLAA